ncbi:hypothetical protein, partial [Actinomadura citrea]|uniref:hypothetical protein n=1 Tax=Actinomadura citrea TaxID=46158 RepID=UPI001E33AFC1
MVGPRNATVGTFRQAGDGATKPGHMPRIVGRTRRYSGRAARVVSAARCGAEGLDALSRRSGRSWDRRCAGR